MISTRRSNDFETQMRKVAAGFFEYLSDHGPCTLRRQTRVLTTMGYWMLQNGLHRQDGLFDYVFGRCRNNSVPLWGSKAGLSTLFLLVCLPRNTTRRPRLNGNFPLQTASSTRRFRLCSKFLQSFHRDPIPQCRLVCGVEEDPTIHRKSQPHAQTKR